MRMLVDAEAGTITMQLGNGKVEKFNLKNDLNRINYLGCGDCYCGSFHKEKGVKKKKEKYRSE